MSENVGEPLHGPDGELLHGDDDSDIMLGDGLFPRRAMMDRDRLERWIEDHNPHLGGTAEWYIWAADCHHDQTIALGDWRRSTLALATRILIGASFVMVAAQVVVIIVALVNR